MAQECVQVAGWVLFLDTDVGFMFALANELRGLGITAIPAMSVAEGESFLAAIEEPVDLLVVNCGMPGALEFARRELEKNPKLQVVGIAAAPFPTLADPFHLAAIIHDPEDRRPRQIRKWALIIGALRSSGYRPN